MSAQNCPYCGVTFSLEGAGAQYAMPRFHSPLDRNLPRPDIKQFTIASHLCPSCKGQVMWLNEIDDDVAMPLSTTLLYPKRPTKLLPSGIPDEYSADFLEANDTLEVSAKASAALSRRCLQNIIRSQEGIEKQSLYDEIKELLARNKLPKYLADDLDAIRHVGNFAAHPIKDKNTGQIVHVEPGEAEWMLQLLEELLDFYFVDTSRSRARREALNEKLKAAGKQPMQ